MVDVSQSQIDELLDRHWAVRLFNLFPNTGYIPMSLLYSVGIFLIGALLALLNRSIGPYLLSPIPYVYVAGYSLILISYGWWKGALRSMLHRLRPALDTEAIKFNDIIVSWNASWVNSLWAAILFGVPFMLLNAWSLFETLSGNVQSTYAIADQFNDLMYGRLIAEWPQIMHGWYAVLFVGLTGFVLGSGVLGLLATMRLIHAMLEEPIRLAYYRYLDAPVSLGSQLASWVLVALISVAFFSRPLVWDLDQPVFISTILQVTVALIVITLVFGLPVVFSRNAIQAAKEQVLAQPLQLVDELYNKLRATPQAPDQTVTADDLEATQKELDQVNKIINSIADIREWQISIVSGLHVSGAFVLSLVSPALIELVKNAILKAT